MGNMKVHQLAREFWDQEPLLSLGCKRLRPLAPKLHSDSTHDDTSTTTTTVSSVDLKSFIRPDSGPRKLGNVPSDGNRRSPPVETQPGATRWNPIQEQIGILEMLYRGGMRTPNAQQIEQITEQLGKYGKIEGKNVFYLFQNHKARERQKQKRSSLGLDQYCTRNSAAPPIITPITLDTTRVDIMEREEDSPYKRKCRSWSFEEDDENRTLELFLLHPESK